MGSHPEIALSYIHKNYRNKRTGRKIVMNKKDWLSYIKALNDLQNKNVNLIIGNVRKRYGMNKSKINNKPILVIKNMNYMENGDISISYDLGKLGEIILKSKRYSTNVPIDIIRKPYQQVMLIYLSMYISRLVYINSRKRNTYFNVKLTSILDNIIIHNKKGYSIGISLKTALNTNITNKYTYLEEFKRNLIYVLELLKKCGVIYGFITYPEDINNISIRNYEIYKLQLQVKKQQ